MDFKETVVVRFGTQDFRKLVNLARLKLSFLSRALVFCD